MRKVIRCGICGLGRIGWGFHLPAVKNCEGMEAVAVADPLQERLDEAEKTYNVPKRAAADSPHKLGVASLEDI